MAKTNPGKVFEQDFKNSVPSSMYVLRVKDQVWGRGMVGSRNPFDYLLFSFPVLYCLELKSTEGTSFSFDEKIIHAGQLDGLAKASKVRGVHSGFLFNFRASTKRQNRLYWVDIESFLSFKASTDKKSINEADCKRIGKEIPCEVLKTHYRYDVASLVRCTDTLDETV